MDRLPETLMACTAMIGALAALIVSIWQQVRIDRNERRTREVKRDVQALKDNHNGAPTGE